MKECIVFISCIIVLCYIQFIHSECCHPTGIFYPVSPGPGLNKCRGIIVLNKCRFEVCNDGQIPKGRYCGIGPCNEIGCDCVGGCIGSNLTENMIDKFVVGPITRGALVGSP